METINRRVFLSSGIVAVAVTSVCLCTLSGCATITKVGNTPEANPESFTLQGRTLSIDLSKEPILSKVSGAVKIKHEAIPDGIIIARVEDKKFEIAALACTHRGVEVEYDASEKNFQCASLGSSTYTLDGLNLKGPAKKPLKIYDATLQSNILRIII